MKIFCISLIIKALINLLMTERSLRNSLPIFLKREYQSQQKDHKSRNMFREIDATKPTLHPKLQHLPKIYDFVGSTNLRQQILGEQMTKAKQQTEGLGAFEEKQERAEMANTVQANMKTTIKQQSMPSQYTDSQIRELTKEMRNLRYYREKEAQWQKQRDRIKRETQRLDQPTLLQRSQKRLQVMPNPEKDDIIKNYVTSYWEMSLRNNSIILKRHLKGHNRYELNQMEELLQRDQGTKEVQGSIPRLPIKELNKISQKQLMLSGKNKLASESVSCDPSIISELTSRRSRALTDLSALTQRQQFLKLNYDLAPWSSKCDFSLSIDQFG